jgi:hypothetical protein
MSLDKGNQDNTTDEDESIGEEGTTSTVTAPASAWNAQIYKCSLHQCKNIDPSTHQVTCCYKDCGKKIHLPCFLTLLVKSNFQRLPADKF